MHSYRKNGLYSGNGQLNLFRSIIPPIDSGGSVRRSWANRGPGSLVAAGFLSCLPGRSGAAAARQGSPCLHSVSIGSQN